MELTLHDTLQHNFFVCLMHELDSMSGFVMPRNLA